MQDTLMRREIFDIPAAVETLLTQGQTAIDRAAVRIAEADPAFFVSVARGSSDHAATYFKYCSEILTGIPVASLGPSVASVYGRRLKVDRATCIAISQSGQSPDIVRMTEMARAEGAATFAITNEPMSDLARAAEDVLSLHAGREQSVAATKTFVNSAVTGIWLLARLQEDEALLAAIRDLPRVLDKATGYDWSDLAGEAQHADSLFCLGRGPGYAIAGEAALKFKETCLLHAEAYSSAEVLHGPVSIVDSGFPVVVLAAADAAEAGMIDVADQLAAKGASVHATSAQGSRAKALPVARTAHPLTDPISLIVSFYAMVEQVAVARGINPDAPRHLKKVTETV